MPINNIETAIKYSEGLDKAFEQQSVFARFADDKLRAQFIGAKTVKIRNLEFVGLVDYDRDNGFSRAKVTIASEPFTLAMDRARSISIDREDMDETGIANLAGQVLGEYVRTMVVPECDSYCVSKLAGVAAANGGVVTTNLANPFKTFTSLVNKAHQVVGYDTELVCFVDGDMYAELQNDTTFNKRVIINDFDGNAKTKIKSVDGVPIIPVSSGRMMSLYDFTKTDTTTQTGGYEAATGAVHIRMLVVPKNGVHLVKKTEKMRIFAPEQNPDADAYKFDYRIYYDVFVKKSALKAIQCCASGTVTTAAAASDDGTEE